MIDERIARGQIADATGANVLDFATTTQVKNQSNIQCVAYWNYWHNDLPKRSGCLKTGNILEGLIAHEVMAADAETCVEI